MVSTIFIPAFPFPYRFVSNPDFGILEKYWNASMIFVLLHPVSLLSPLVFISTHGVLSLKITQYFSNNLRVHRTPSLMSLQS